MIRQLFLLAAAWGLAAPAFAQTTAPSAFEYHGYMRSGIGGSRGGADQACFGAPGASAKFRLGNECETYIETEFVHIQPLTTDAKGPAFKTHFLLAAVSGQGRDWESTQPVLGTDANNNQTVGSDFTLALREAYVEGQKVLGSTRPWIGKRFYRRQDIHILDYYILNDSGPGAGVEDIPVGIGNLNLAVLRNTPAGAGDGPAQTNADVRLSDLSLGAGGTLELIAIQSAVGKRGHATGKDEWEAVSGTQLGFVHTVKTPAGGNRLTVQYGVGVFGGRVQETKTDVVRTNLLTNYGADGTQAVAKGDTEGRDALKKSSTARVAEELTTQIGRSFSSSFVAVWQRTDFGGYKEKLTSNESPDKTETLIGARPILSLTDHTSLALEYGYAAVQNAFLDNGTYKDAVLHKLTLAPQLTAGPDFFARPQLRLFATYARWNDDAKGHIGGLEYAGSTSGFSTGAQVEAWW